MWQIIRYLVSFNTLQLLICLSLRHGNKLQKVEADAVKEQFVRSGARQVRGRRRICMLIILIGMSARSASRRRRAAGHRGRLIAAGTWHKPASHLRSPAKAGPAVCLRASISQAAAEQRLLGRKPLPSQQPLLWKRRPPKGSETPLKSLFTPNFKSKLKFLSFRLTSTR